MEIKTTLQAPGSTAWRDTLGIGDVVLFPFPCADPNKADGPKMRPCLVLHVYRREGRRWAELAFGTSSNSDANRGHDISLSEPRELASAGLRRPTRFVAARRVTVALNASDWNVHPVLGTPVIGHLGPRAHAELAQVVLDIGAQRSLMAKRKRQPLPFTVEHRRRRSYIPGTGSSSHV